MKNMDIHENFPDTHHDSYSKTVFGFWVYLITDFMLFATLFAAYAVLRHSTFGGPSAKQLFNVNYSLIETLFMLSCGFAVGLAGAATHRKNKKLSIALFFLAFVLGVVFLVLQYLELFSYVQRGFGWQKSAFLSAFFTLVGTFWFHVAIGLLWILVFIIPVCWQGLTSVNIKRLTCLRMFWQFLNVIWVFIFSIVYLIGVIK